MAQDPQAQAIRKRKATLKIARLKAEKAAAEQNGTATASSTSRKAKKEA
ncbi:MAG: hypothetical protein IPH05_13965 [Flavobacteriales bacterium]|jgi:hypothetical protein|nr:hypothetical protein [Flavobacteriales bacterium]MBK6549395.1 hypothetical protein [Flavobacteriales bacterium]MBK6884017.1 hypothetical protein [Flavobacteriales bacterium]MBK7481157.1 hypothetical protein [Flavobacteriales bacterium]MBK8533570.1 hypothetical protein [Flavobacteriales bacterium]